MEVKEVKARKAREESERGELAGCTFKPNITRAAPSGDDGEKMAPNNTIEGSELSRQSELFHDHTFTSTSTTTNTSRQNRRKSVEQSLRELDDFIATEGDVLNTSYQHPSDNFVEPASDDDDSGMIYYEEDHLDGAPEGMDEILPAGWLKFLTEDGKPYYHCALTGETSWSRPDSKQMFVSTPAKSLSKQVRSNSIDDNDHANLTTSENWIDAYGNNFDREDDQQWRR